MLSAGTITRSPVGRDRRHADEAEVGAGIAAGGVDRSERWLTTKAWTDDLEPGGSRATAAARCASCGTDHLDSLLLHWPNARVVAQARPNENAST